MVHLELKKAFDKAVVSKENILEDNNINWNFVDADLCLDGWLDKLGKAYYPAFEELATEHNLNVAGDRLDVLKSDYLGQ
jgi:hypothetical protein